MPGAATTSPAGNSSLVAAADGRLYGVSETSTGTGDPRIISVDPATGAIATALVWPNPNAQLVGLTRLGDALYGIRDENPMVASTGSIPRRPP